MFKARAEVAVLKSDYSKQAMVLIHISIYLFYFYFFGRCGEWSNIEVTGGGKHRQIAGNIPYCINVPKAGNMAKQVFPTLTLLTTAPPTELVQSLVVALKSCSWETLLGAAVFHGHCQLRTS